MPREAPVIAQKVPPVPDRLLAERPPAQPGTAASTNEARAASTPPQVQPPQADTWPLPKTDPVAPPQTAVAPVAPPPIQAAPPATAATVGQAQAAQPPAAAENRVEAAPRIEAPPRIELPRVEPPRAEATAVEPPRAEAPPPRVDVLRLPPTAPAEPQEARTAQPREEVSRPVSRDTPIGVRVDSWVELRAANGDVLTQTYVRAGETYTIPAGIAFRVITAR